MHPGSERNQLAQELNAAYGDGLLSQTTLMFRLDQLLTGTVIEPTRLVGDLTRRVPRTWVSTAAQRLRNALTPRRPDALLALDWSGGGHERLLIGRHPSCDIVLSSPNVSRRHARLQFRDGSWILRDLDSTNGTRVNGVPVGRCELRPGDELTIGVHLLTVD